MRSEVGGGKLGSKNRPEKTNGHIPTAVSTNRNPNGYRQYVYIYETYTIYMYVQSTMSWYTTHPLEMMEVFG